MPHLTLAEVHAALAYYYDHLDAIRVDWREGERLAADMKKTFPPGSRPTTGCRCPYGGRTSLLSASDAQQMARRRSPAASDAYFGVALGWVPIVGSAF